MGQMRKQQMWCTLTWDFSNVFTPSPSWCRGCSRFLTCCWRSTAASTSPSTAWRGAAPGDNQHRSWARSQGRSWTPGGTPAPAPARVSSLEIPSVYLSPGAEQGAWPAAAPAPAKVASALHTDCRRLVVNWHLSLLEIICSINGEILIISGENHNHNGFYFLF